MSGQMTAVGAAFAFFACVRPLVVRPPSGPVRSVQNKAILDSLRVLGLDGDWLVTRGYHFSDHVVTTATNIPLSHVGILDREGDQVVEALGGGVRTVPLDSFVDHSHRLLLLRPRWSVDSTRAPAVKAARSLVGKAYDFLGTVGFDFPERYYCSELALHCYRPFIPESEKFPAVVEPGQLYLWGRVLYDSGPRDGGGF